MGTVDRNEDNPATSETKHASPKRKNVAGDQGRIVAVNHHPFLSELPTLRSALVSVRVRASECLRLARPLR